MTDSPGWHQTPGVSLANRPRLTAKGYRALGYPIPESIPDDAIVELIIEESSVTH